jgi:hypothetical protein
VLLETFIFTTFHVSTLILVKSMNMWMSSTSGCKKIILFLLLFEHYAILSIYVIVMYVSCNPRTYMVPIWFAFRNKVWYFSSYDDIVAENILSGKLR